MKAIIKRKNLLKSLIICIDFNVIFKKIFGLTLLEHPQKTGLGRSTGVNARFVKTQQHQPPHQIFLDLPLPGLF